jgi:hypothetical protein
LIELAVTSFRLATIPRKNFSGSDPLKTDGVASCPQKANSNQGS